MNPIALKHCQVSTPADIVSMMWKMVRSRRRKVDSVLDLGAGDGRFAQGAGEALYVGYEIDAKKIPSTTSPKRKFVNKDVLDCRNRDFSLAIGNPPYIRKELLDSAWRERAIDVLAAESGGIRPRADSNAFVYFLWLALLRTEANGLVVQLVPFEWVSRPSAGPLRQFIEKEKWNVDVYRFSEEIFDRVLTTAAIVVIDKAKKDSRWQYFTVRRDGKATANTSPTGSDVDTLAYADRGAYAFALRGLSPGGQDVYVLTDEERRLQGLKIDTDVSPCVTTLRHLEADQLALTDTLFEKAFVKAGHPCWLIRSDRDRLSPALSQYLELAKKRAMKYTTNSIRGEKEWFKYRIHPVPDILVASGFREKGPKSFLNQAGVVTLGSVYAVFVKGRERRAATIKALRHFDFESQVVSHSNGLKKIEVRQLNSALTKIIVG